jgi:hypothetical protein
MTDHRERVELWVVGQDAPIIAEGGPRKRGPRTPLQKIADLERRVAELEHRLEYRFTNAIAGGSQGRGVRPT